jgi:hypothetical protein
MQEALNELADLSNYARYTFIRVRLMQVRLQIQAQNEQALQPFVATEKVTDLNETGLDPSDQSDR